MRILTSALLALILCNLSNAQDNVKPLPLNLPTSEIQARDISSPDVSDIENAGNGSETNFAALAALKQGNAFWNSGKVQLSSASYETAVSLDPSLYSAQFNLGLTLLRTKQYGPAAAAFDAATRLKPDSARAWHSLGLARYHAEQYPKAVAAFREAQRLTPDDAILNNNLGFAYVYAGQLQEAIAAFETALRIDSELKAAKKGLCDARALAKDGDAVGACLTAVQMDPDSAMPRYFLGVAYVDAGETEKGMSAFEEAARIEPETAKIRVGMGFASFKLENYRDALKHFEEARKLDANVEFALLGLGATYARMKDYKNAEEFLRQAMSSKPDDPTTRFNLALVCLARKDRECALSQYNSLKMLDDSLAGSLFSTIYQNKVVDVSRNNKKR